MGPINVATWSYGWVAVLSKLDAALDCLYFPNQMSGHVDLGMEEGVGIRNETDQAPIGV